MPKAKGDTVFTKAKIHDVIVYPLKKFVDERGRLAALLDSLQALARGDAATSIPREPVELADVLDAAVHAARRRHAGTRFELRNRAGRRGARL